MDKFEKIASKIAAFSGTSILAVSNDVEFVYNLFTGDLQIGMGGEWWVQKIHSGRNIFHHRKENVDPAYKPVMVIVSDNGEGIRFDVNGGFGYEASFVISVKGK